MKTLKISLLIPFSISLFILSLLLYSFSLPHVDFEKQSEKGIQFHQGNWEEALVLAGESNKLIFLDIYATWCGPCKKLKITTFENIEVGAYYNSHFINVAIDGETDEGKLLMRQFRLSAYPSLLFVDADGKVKLQTGGYQNVNSFLKLGKKAIKTKKT